MPQRLCTCGSCEYCTAYLRYEMDLEFGRGTPKGNTRVDRIKNLLHHQHHEEMCREFGTGGTTYEQRKSRQGPMPSGDDIADALTRR